jgi:hypothetical protein
MTKTDATNSNWVVHFIAHKEFPVLPARGWATDKALIASKTFCRSHRPLQTAGANQSGTAHLLTVSLFGTVRMDVPFSNHAMVT